MKPNKLQDDVVSLLIPRLEDEYKAFYMYRAASNWCKNVGYFVAAEFFANESKDELKHAKKIEAYLVDWNVTPDLPVIEKPQLEFTTLVELIEAAYNVEYDLYEAYEDTSKQMFNKDLCVFDFLQEFRMIQKEAVAEYSDKLNMLEGVDANKMNLLLIEHKLFQVNG
jgi:ferritin